MFGEKYKRDMENVAPSPESLVKTKEKMMEACVKKPRRIYTRQLIAVATCLLIISGAVTFAVLQRSNDTYKDLENPYLTKPNVGNDALSDDAKLKYEVRYENIYSKIKDLPNYSNTVAEEFDVVTGSPTNQETGTVGGSNGAPKDSNGSTTAPQTPQSNYGGTTLKDYSDTNNQVEGVQEADIVKTDGKYIYACQANARDIGYYYGLNSYKNINTSDTSKVYILSADNGKMNLVSTITFRNGYNDTYYVLKEILLYDNTLVLIKEGYKYTAPETSDTSGNTKFYYSYYGYYSNQLTSVEIYDLTDRANPVFKNELYQSGFYTSSRMIGKNLYIISNYFVYNPDESKPETYIPYCSSYDAEYLLPADCIFIPETVSSSQYNIITGIDVSKPENHKSSVATLGFSGTIYASDKNIYIASYNYNYMNYAVKSQAEAASNTDTNSNWTETNNDSTNIYRFSIKDGTINLAASGKINGGLINQFAMDEYKDAFRVAVTVNEYTMSYGKSNGEVIPSYGSQKRYNDLYILDMNLNLMGSVTNMAPNETIYSVRFDGEIGYVVTFRQVDPLFAIDLSDVTAPKVLSALKIPGFSTYMHAYGEGLLFGIGKDADSNGRTYGIKLSMFDVTDKANVTEKSIYKLGISSFYSNALYNHKAILVDPEKNIIGFAVDDYDAAYNTKCSYKIFRYENNEFKEVTSFPLNTYAGFDGLRGFYIGDYIYVFAQSQFINSYHIGSLSLVDSYAFN